jgi:hypothetical protein
LKELQPIFCDDLLKEIDDQLLDIVKSISIDEWNKKTLYPNWKVNDIFSHIIDTSIRKLSGQRDKYFDTSTSPRINSYNDLVHYIEKLADDWTESTRRISPQIMIKLYSEVKDELHQFIKNLDPYEDALFSVAWAGEITSKNWFDTAREYTEHWIHQQQIRDALDLDPIDQPKYIKAVLETFIRSIPIAYNKANIVGKLGIEITGSINAKYCLLKKDTEYQIFEGEIEDTTAKITVDCMEFCKMLARIINPKDMKYRINGDKQFGEIVLNSIALMA